MHVLLIEFTTSIPYTMLLVDALADLCDVSLLLPNNSPYSVNIDKERIDLHLFDMPRISRPANVLMVKNLLKQISEIKPDIVHVTFWSPWMMPAMSLFLNIPVVTTIHDVDRHTGERGLWAIPSVLYRWQWQWSNQVIVHATTAREQLVNHYGYSSKRVHVIPIGIFNSYRNLIQFQQQERPNKILFFGRIWGYKGLQYLIEAEPLITQIIPDARIIIAGQGESFEKYQAMMVNPDHFEIHNYRIPDEQVAHLFQQASVVALPYIEASQSGVVAVAYAFGKPVVATKVGGIPDMVIDGQTGLLVPPNDAYSLAEAIITLLKDESKRRQMGHQARNFAETELSWSRIAQKIFEVYQQVKLEGGVS